MTENELRSVLSTQWWGFYPNPDSASLTWGDLAQVVGYPQIVYEPSPQYVSPYWTVKGSPRTLTAKPVKRVLTIVGHN